ncbi:MAG: VWA domain-containing protein, partial [Victivallales bacterium]|nr:VWA domain-containing protein [Victivallales bacterium]
MFTHPSYLNLLWLLPVLGTLFLLTAHRCRHALSRIAGPNAAAALLHETPSGFNLLRGMLLLGAVLLLVIALAGPAWNPVEEKIDRQGRDVVFVLDVSRSMLAEDLRPSRLERAKADVAECIESLQGDRVALVAFAGNAVVQCPLTQDYGFFRMMLADLTTESVTRGGTNLGDALRLAQKQVFDGTEKEYKDIILITDGEDHDSLPVAAAQELGAAGIRLIAIGIGDDTVGTPIQVTDERGYKSVLKYHGEVVRTKLDSQTLREMAQATPGGIYLPVGTNAFDLRETYQHLIASADQKDLETSIVIHLQPKFQIFLGMAMILLALATLLPQRKRVALLPLAMLLLSTNALNAQTARELFKEGNKVLKTNPTQAIQFYDQAAQALGDTQWKELEFNRALAYYRLGPEHHNDAITILQKAIELNNSTKRDEKFDNYCQLLSGNINYSLAKTAYNSAFPAKDSDNPQEIQQALQLIEKHEDVIKDAIHSLKHAKTNRH